MSRLRSRRAWAVGACAALTAGVSGCTSAGGGSSSSVTVSGTALTIYASQPPSSPSWAADVIDAERLAFQQSGSRAGKYTLHFSVLTGKPADNARKAISDQTTVAYLGELAPGQSADSIGITNALDVLQVSPTDTALELTQSTPAVPGAPDDYYESKSTYGRTFGRVVPSASAEAKAQVAEMAALGVKTLHVADDGTPYGKAIATAVRSAAAMQSIAVATSRSGAGGEFFGTASAAAAQREFSGAGAPEKLFGPSGIDPSALTAPPANLYLSSPGFLPKQLPPGASSFTSSFTSTYGHRPAPQALFGYEAMKAVIAAIAQAGNSANDRSTVVRDFFALKRGSDSALGPYSISSDGDSSLTTFVFSAWRGGRFTALTEQQG